MELTPEEKIKKARKLLQEATWEIRQNRKIELENDKCKCGHKRKDHSVSYSINYTEGICSKCDCLHFLQAD